jgi:transcriptional regulator GlxA family with amidase domain
MISAVFDHAGKPIAKAQKWNDVAVAEVDLSERYFWRNNLGDFHNMVHRHRPPAPAAVADAPKGSPPKTSATKESVKTVAILLFDGVELMDFSGPAEVFIIAGNGKAFRVVTVAESAKPVKTMGGITVTPDCTFANAPKADIVIVPGGNTRAVGEAGKAWLKKASGDAEITMSVCFGAFLLADIGRLDGIEATTHHWGIDDLKRSAPKCKVVSGQRFTDSGRIITTAGVTAGIDGALHVVERVLGPDEAKWAADEWMEHHRSSAQEK